jgi:hypothetical protein
MIVQFAVYLAGLPSTRHMLGMTEKNREEMLHGMAGDSLGSNWNTPLQNLTSHPDRHEPRTSVRINNYRSCVNTILSLLEMGT